jgi:phosphoribosyl 1,2-cyclic phosphate phosphodiesterase
MELTFLGSGAAEGYPAPWCRCANCEAARARGGRDLRGRSALLINDDLLIDLGPDLVLGAQRAGRPLDRVRYILITHSHGDHLYLSNLEIRERGYRATDLPMADLYSDESVLRHIREHYPHGTQEQGVVLHDVEPGQRFSCGPYTVQAVPAMHGDPSMRPLLYAIADGQRSMFYGTDTGPLAEEAWTVLRGWRFDAVILDETMGFTAPARTHMAVSSFEDCVARMRDEGLLAPGVRVLAHHFSHHHNPPYADLVAYFGPRGVEVAYDGLRVTLAGASPPAAPTPDPA